MKRLQRGKNGKKKSGDWLRNREKKEYRERDDNYVDVHEQNE